MNLVCINCPLGCNLTVEEKDGVITVSGNTCKRGEEYGISEMRNPMRTLTSTIKINSSDHSRLPVITSKPIPKARIMDVIKELKKVEVNAPINMNDVIVSNILDLGVDIIASRSIK